MRSLIRIGATLLAAAALACSESVAPLEEDQAAILFWGRSDTALSIQLKRIEYGGAPAEVLLTEAPGYTIGPLWPSPDGRSLLYSRRTNLGNLATVERLLDGSPAPVGAPGTPLSWSPDGSHILWQGVWGEPIVTDENGAVLDTLPWVSSVTWAPNGQGFYGVFYDSLGNAEVGRWPLWSDSAVNISSDTAYDVSPAPSPDGRLIAFASYRQNNLDWYLMGADGSQQRRIHAGSCCAESLPPLWSPNSRLLALLQRFQWVGDDRDELVVFDTQGTIVSKRRFPFNTLLSMAWAPTRNVLMFVARVDGGTGPYQVFVMRPDASDLRQVTFEPTGVGGAVWAPR